jgi:hypothetical protein
MVILKLNMYLLISYFISYFFTFSDNYICTVQTCMQLFTIIELFKNILRTLLQFLKP